MNTENDTDVSADPAVDREQRYGELNIGDEEFVIYDRENHRAWIQSAVTVTTEELR